MSCCRNAIVPMRRPLFAWLLPRGYEGGRRQFPWRAARSWGAYAIRIAAGAVLLLLCLWLGAQLATVSPLPLPAPLIGMVLLAAFLAMRRGPTATAASAAGDLLLRRYALFFVPAGVGVITQAGMLRGAWLAIAASVLVSSLLALAVTSLVMRLLLASGRGGSSDRHGDPSS